MMNNLYIVCQEKIYTICINLLLKLFMPQVTISQSGIVRILNFKGSVE